MIPARRRAFNGAFTPARYHALLGELAARVGPVEFRVSETPCFFEAALLERFSARAIALVRALLDNPEYRRAADAVVPDAFRVANAETEPTCVQVDFGLLETETGVEGRLVELQAFPSLYGFQPLLAQVYQDTFEIAGMTAFLEGRDDDAYLEAVRRAIVGEHDPDEVVLLEIDPAHQKTRPDFEATRQFWGVRAVDVRAIRRDGRRLVDGTDGRRRPIARVYNRVIPDELVRSGLTLAFDYRDDLDVEWVGGPDWFFRISKFSLIHLRDPWVPETHSLAALDRLPDDRDQWVLKPLFSFAGAGITFAPTDEDVARLAAADRSHYALQRRVAFTPLIETPFGPTQAEIRIMLIRTPAGYRALIPLVRMGRGRMMGVDHNKGLAWVGASAALME